jgi:large subunit ribosomal protein L21e
VMSRGNTLRGLSYLLIDYHAGDKVVVDIDSREHTTTPHRRFQGRMGVVKNVGKRIVKVSVMLGGKQKILQVKPNHIKPLVHTKSEKDNEHGGD